MLQTSKKAKEAAVEALLLKNYNQYYRLACSYTHNDADAGDIVQNGAYKAIKNSGQLKNINFASTWVYRIMLNEIYHFYHQNRTDISNPLSEEMPTEDTYENIDLARALDALPPKEQTVIKLKFFEDLKLEEIADITEENLSTVKSRLYRGLQKLRIKLDRSM